MRRTITAMMATVLVLGATPALATDATDTEPAAGAADGATEQRIEVPAAGFAIAFPSDWEVRTLEARRESEILTAPEADPIYVTTFMMAKAADGRWCDVDVYEEIPVPLDQHVYAYAGYLQSVYEIDRAVEVTETELPLGEAFRIDMLDNVRERVWAMYLFDQATPGDTAPDRFLVTCVDDPGGEPWWESIADSMELLPPAEEPAAEA